MKNQDKIKMNQLNDEIDKKIKEYKKLQAYENVSTPDVEKMKEKMLEDRKEEIIELTKQFIEYSKVAMQDLKNKKIQQINSNLAKLSKERLECTNPEEFAEVDAKIDKNEKELQNLQNYENDSMKEILERAKKVGITSKDLGIQENIKETRKRSNFISRFFAALFGKFKKPERKREYKQSQKEGRKTVRQHIRETAERVSQWADNVLEDNIGEVKDANQQAEKTEPKNPEPKDNTKDSSQDKSDETIEKSMRADFEEYFAKVEEGYEDILPKAYINYKKSIIKEYMNPEDKKKYQFEEMQGNKGFESIYKDKKSLVDYCYDAKEVLDAEIERDKSKLEQLEDDKDKDGKPKDPKQISQLKKSIGKKTKEISELKKAIKNIKTRKQEIMDKEQKGEEEPTQQQEPVQPQPEPPQTDYKAIKQKFEGELMAYFNEIQMDYKDILPQVYYDEISKIVEESINDSHFINRYKSNGIEDVLPSDGSIVHWITVVEGRLNNELNNYREQYKDTDFKPIDYVEVINNINLKLDAITKAMPEIEQRYAEIEKSNQQQTLSEDDIIKNKISTVLYGKFSEWHEGYEDVLIEEYTQWYYKELEKVINDEDIIAQVKQEGIEWYENSLGHFDNEETRVNWIISNVKTFINEYVEDENAKQVVLDSIFEMRDKIEQRYEEKYKENEHENGENDEHDENEHGENGENPPGNTIPEAKFDIKTAKYTIKDKDGNTIELDFDKKLLSKKAKVAFAVELMNRYGNAHVPIKTPKELAENMDINLYRLYEEYDKLFNTDIAKKYVYKMQYEGEPLPTKMTYDLTTRGSKVQTPFLSRGDIKKLAEIQEDFELAQVERDPKLSLGKKIALGLGIGGTVAAIGGGILAGVNHVNDKKAENNKNIEKTDENIPVIDMKDLGINVTEQNEEKQTTQSKQNTFKDSMKVSGVEQSVEVLKQKIEEKLENQIGIGSKAILEEGTYYYDSEGNGPIGKMENRQNKEVEIKFIATVNKDGKYENCLMKGNIADAKQLGENLKIMIAIENKDGDLGWISFDEVKGNFIDYINQQQSQEAVK